MTNRQTISSYKDLDVWSMGMRLAELTYLLTKDFPAEERYGLTSQMRRCSVSIPANIAEGWGRQSRQDYIRFLRISQGSLRELETFLIFTTRIQLLSDEQIAQAIDLIENESRMLRSLIQSLERGKNRA